MHSYISNFALCDADHLHSGLLAAGFTFPKLAQKVVEVFIATFVSTGLFLGIIYVLVTRAMKVNRKAVETWFEQQRLRLQSGPVPVIEWAQPVMLAGLYAIYGRNILRRLVSSCFIGLFFTSIIFMVVFSHYRLTSVGMQEKKIQLERKADPKLYDYATNPALTNVYEESRQMDVDVAADIVTAEPTYTNAIHVELRKRMDDYSLALKKCLAASPDRLNLTLLFVMQGNLFNPGFQLGSLLCLFLYNVLLDFVSVTIAISFLRQLALNFSLRRATVLFCYTAGGTVVCWVTAFLSYWLFFHGDPDIFVEVLLMLPLSLAATIYGGAIMLVFPVSKLWKKKEHDDPPALFGLLYGGFFAFFGLVGLHYLATVWAAASLGTFNLRDPFSFPYILAATTLVPATVTLAAFSLMLTAKITAEPARVLPEAYMTFIKEEIGGTQASGLILILGIIAGVFAGLICGVN